MIKFKAVRYKNLLSTGNQFTEIFLGNRKATLILGENGSGKSTMLDALCFGLFGKGFRKVSKNSLIKKADRFLQSTFYELPGFSYPTNRDC